MAGRKVIHKRELDHRVATITGFKPADVARITRQFIADITGELVDMNDVQLDSLGTLHPYIRSGTRVTIATLTSGTRKNKNMKPMQVAVDKKYYVGFKRAGALKDAFRAQHRSPQEKSHGKVRSR